MFLMCSHTAYSNPQEASSVIGRFRLFAHRQPAFVIEANSVFLLSFEKSPPRPFSRLGQRVSYIASSVVPPPTASLLYIHWLVPVACV